MNNFIGIDISKNTFDVHYLSDGRDQCFEYTSENVNSCSEEFLSLKPTLVVMEATGGYETRLASELQAAGLPVAIINPKRIRDFAKAVGQTAKTDKLDARIIARYASVLQPPPTNVVDESSRKIKALVARKRQLTAMRTAEKNRLEHKGDDFIDSSILFLINAIENQIAETEKQIRNHIANAPELMQKAELIKSAPGIAENTAAALVSGVPELGKLNRRQIAALIGVAPINRDSGQFRGKRMTGGGRREIRTALYMPTLVAIQHNPVIRAQYQRLLLAGKPKMVAVVAAMRKFIIILNSMVAKNEPWRSEK